MSTIKVAIMKKIKTFKKLGGNIKKHEWEYFGWEFSEWEPRWGIHQWAV